MQLSPRKKNIMMLSGIALIALGLALGLADNQGDSPDAQESVELVLTIRAGQEISASEKPSKSEWDVIREAIDWSDAPTPAPELVESENFDIYVNVTREFLEYVLELLDRELYIFYLEWELHGAIIFL